MESGLERAAFSFTRMVALCVLIGGEGSVEGCSALEGGRPSTAVLQGNVLDGPGISPGQPVVPQLVPQNGRVDCLKGRSPALSGTGFALAQDSCRALLLSPSSHSGSTWHNAILWGRYFDGRWQIAEAKALDYCGITG